MLTVMPCAERLCWFETCSVVPQVPPLARFTVYEALADCPAAMDTLPGLSDIDDVP